MYQIVSGIQRNKEWLECENTIPADALIYHQILDNVETQLLKFLWKFFYIFSKLCFNTVNWKQTGAVNNLFINVHNKFTVTLNQILRLVLNRT